ncbi:hypothetical protein BKI52_04380 [marine bacterium AO1-C]|nr:hypothetical protein BKI52_04380 [marine bacterium AO1-C]
MHTHIPKKPIFTDKVFIIEKHHHVLEAWAKLYGTQPTLITFDQHTDTREAFHFLLFKLQLEKQSHLNKRKELCNAIDYQSQKSILNAISKLCHDEHIDTAIRSGLLNKAIAIISGNLTARSSERVFKVLDKSTDDIDIEALSMMGRKTLELRKVRESQPVTQKIFFYELPEVPPNNQVIESDHLKAALDKFEPYVPKSGWWDNFILDIDLDYFHTRKAIQPKDVSFFQELIRQAKMITIAREPKFVGFHKEEHDPNISVEFLEGKLLAIIEEALSSG